MFFLSPSTSFNSTKDLHDILDLAIVLILILYAFGTKNTNRCTSRKFFFFFMSQNITAFPSPNTA